MRAKLNRINRRPAARQRGVVIIITLLAVILLAALIMFVLNLGQQVERRIYMQNTADAAAVSSAAWTARSLNTVALNNVDMARTIALINVLDAMPQSAINVEDESKAFRDRLNQQLASGIGGGPADLTEAVESALRSMRGRYERIVEETEPVNDFFDRIDLTTFTHYDPDTMAEKGALWQKLYALDEMNQAIMENLGQVSQSAGQRGGEINLRNEADAGVVVLPHGPQVPYERGTFNDFKRPVVWGLLPENVDDTYSQRGPWDTVFGWRTTQSERVGGQYVEGEIGGVDRGRGTTPASSGSGGNRGRTIGGTTVVNGYRVYGPREWLIEQVNDFNDSHFVHARLNMWVKEIADIKLDRVWPNTFPHFRHYHNTEWVTSYTQAKEAAERHHRTRRLPRILQTAYFVVEIKSKYPRGHANFMDDGTWRYANGSPRVSYLGNQNGNSHGTAAGPWAGWGGNSPRYDAANWGIEKLNDWVWREEWSYTTLWDTEIGALREEDDEGNPVRQTIHRIDYFIFAGANLAFDQWPTDPFEGFDPNADDSPAPMNIDLDQLEHDSIASRFEHLNYLAVARHTDVPQTWPSKFRGQRPYPNVVSIAQAKVFNNHSWDSWTPMWHARLTPVRDGADQIDLEDWVRFAAQGTPAWNNTPSREAGDTATYLQGVAPLAPYMMSH